MLLLISLLLGWGTVQCEIPLDVDSVQVNLQHFLNPCTSLRHRTHAAHIHAASYAATNRNRRLWNRDDAVKRIDTVFNKNWELKAAFLLQQIERFPDFDAYIRNNNDFYSATTTSAQALTHAQTEAQSLSSTNSASASSPSSPLPLKQAIGEVWKPYPNQHLPYAFFDSTVNQTRLTWCEHDKHFQKNDVLWKALRNRRIMFIGDSVTRYQYLDFVYFLTYKTWNTELKYINEKDSYSNWFEFFNYTNSKLSGYELCECQREKEKCCEGWSVTENRRYHHPILNATVWFIHWFGDVSNIHGHFNINLDIQPLSCMPGKCGQEATNHSWSYSSAAEFIHQFVLAHHPHFVVLNSGLHVNSHFNGNSDFFARESALFMKYTGQWRQSRIPTRLIFKSTTTLTTDPLTDNRDRDLGALQLAIHDVWDYWDVMTLIYRLFLAYRKVETPHVFFSESNVSRGFTWDFIHFTPWVYNEMNKALIVKYLLK